MYEYSNGYVYRTASRTSVDTIRQLVDVLEQLPDNWAIESLEVGPVDGKLNLCGTRALARMTIEFHTTRLNELEEILGSLRGER